MSTHCYPSSCCLPLSAFNAVIGLRSVFPCLIVSLINCYCFWALVVYIYTYELHVLIHSNMYVSTYCTKGIVMCHCAPPRYSYQLSRSPLISVYHPAQRLTTKRITMSQNEDQEYLADSSACRVWVWCHHWKWQWRNSQVTTEYLLRSVLAGDWRLRYRVAV